MNCSRVVSIQGRRRVNSLTLAINVMEKTKSVNSVYDVVDAINRTNYNVYLLGKG